MVRVGHFDDDGFDVRQVGRHRDAVVQEAGVRKTAVIVVDVFLVEGPADTLGDTALHLAFDIARMDRLAGVLRHDEAQHRDLAGVGIDLDIAEGRGEARCLAAGGDRVRRADRPARGTRLGGEVFQRQWFELADIAARRLGVAVLPVDAFDVDIPDLRGTAAQLDDDLLAGADHRYAAGVGHARAAGDVGVGYRGGVADRGADMVVRNAQRFRRHDRHRGARAADVRAAGGSGDRAVGVDVDRRARLAGAVEPIARRHAAALVRPERRLVAWMVEDRLHGLAVPFVRHGIAGDHRVAGMDRVLGAERRRLDTYFLGQNVDRAFHREVRDRRARRAVGRGLGPVADDVVARRLLVGNVVHRERAQAAVHHRRTREGAGLVHVLALRGGNRAVLLGADLDLHVGPRGRTARLEHLFASHVDAHRKAGLARQHDRDRFDIGDGLAAEAPAQLRRVDLEVAERNADDLRDQVADHEMALAGAPQLGLTVRVAARERRMRLDIALMHRRCAIFLLDDLVGLGETFLDITDLEPDDLGDVRRLGRRRIHFAGYHVLEQQRRVFGCSRLDIDDMRQHFVIDLDQRAGLRRHRRTDRGDRGNRMALVKRFFARHDVAGDVPKIGLNPRRPDIGEFMIRQVGRCHHRLHAGQRLGLGGVDRVDAGMGVRAAQDLSIQGARQAEVVAKLGDTGHFRHAVGTNLVGADPLVRLLDFVHLQPSP